MTKIAVCDDDIEFISLLRKKLEDFMQNTGDSFQIQLFSEADQLFHALDDSFDLYFLDIRMPVYTGNEIAARIRQMEEVNGCSPSSIIFISSLHDAVFESIQYNPLRFIRKEFLEEELGDAMKAYLHIQEKKNEKEICIEFSEKGISYPTKLSDLMFIEARGHYLDIYTKETSFHIRGKLSDYENILTDHYFALAHQGCLVNARNILRCERETVILSDGSRIYISRNCFKDVNSVFMRFKRREHHVLTI